MEFKAKIHQKFHIPGLTTNPVWEFAELKIFSSKIGAEDALQKAKAYCFSKNSSAFTFQVFDIEKIKD